MAATSALKPTSNLKVGTQKANMPQRRSSGGVNCGFFAEVTKYGIFHQLRVCLQYFAAS